MVVAGVVVAVAAVAGLIGALTLELAAFGAQFEPCRLQVGRFEEEEYDNEEVDGEDEGEEEAGVELEVEELDEDEIWLPAEPS